jgi:hypothetical protein
MQPSRSRSSLSHPLTQMVLTTLMRMATTHMTLFLSFHRRSLPGLVLVCGAFLLMTAPTSAQETKTRTTSRGSSVSITNYKEIPAATEACTSEECDWWNRLREAGNNVLRKGDQKSRSVYASLFVEGIEKSYRVPLSDRPSQGLIGPSVQIPDLRLRRLNGAVKLSVENRADGSVGEIKLLSGLAADVDRRCIQAAQNVIFLPAVRDHKFVTAWEPAEFKFYAAGASH